jgi:hypothetical protein
VDKLFRVQRIKWAQFYDSERTVLSALQLNPQSRVLDIGADPGGLGIALRERFGVRSYTALASDESQKKEVKTIYPEAIVLQNASQVPAEVAFDLVTALGIEDTPEFFGTIVPSAFQRLRAGGSLVFSLRLTELATVQDKVISYQNVFVGRGAKEQRAYVVRNTHEVIEALRKLGAARIYAYGYSGTPSSTAKTPFKSVCFSVFAVTRGSSNQGSHEPQVELHIPPQLLKGALPAKNPS